MLITSWITLFASLCMLLCDRPAELHMSRARTLTVSFSGMLSMSILSESLYFRCPGCTVSKERQMMGGGQAGSSELNTANVSVRSRRRVRFYLLYEHYNFGIEAYTNMLNCIPKSHSLAGTTAWAHPLRASNGTGVNIKEATVSIGAVIIMKTMQEKSIDLCTCLVVITLPTRPAGSYLTHWVTMRWCSVSAFDALNMPGAAFRN